MFSRSIAFLCGAVVCSTITAAPLGHFQTIVDDEDGHETMGFTTYSAESSDDRFIYTISNTEAAINIFQRGADQRLTFVDNLVGNNATGEGIRSPDDILMSPDDRHLYVLALQPDNVVPTVYVYERDIATGLLEEVQAYQGRGLSTPSKMLMSDDGLYIYVSSINSHSVTVLSRAANGVLTERQFITEVSRDLSGVYDYTEALALSPDQQHLYVGLGTGSSPSNDGVVVHFEQDTATGALTYIDQVDFTQDGIENLTRPSGLVVSPDGDFLYAVGRHDSVFEFALDEDGRMSFLREAGIDQPDPDISQIYVLNNVQLSNNGHLLYTSDTITDSLLVFHRDEASGALSYLGAEVHGKDGVVELRQNDRVRLSDDSRYAYVGSAYAFTVFDLTADVEISSSSSRNGNDAELVLSLTNNGAASAHHVRYRAELDAGLAVLSADGFRPSTECEIQQNVVTCEIDRLILGESEDITLSLSAQQEEVLQVTSTVVMDEVEAQPDNNTLVDEFDFGSEQTDPDPEPEPEGDRNNNGDSNGGGSSGGSFGFWLACCLSLLLAARKYKLKSV